jgi:hypothetical protein
LKGLSQAYFFLLLVRRFLEDTHENRGLTLPRVVESQQDFEAGCGMKGNLAISEYARLRYGVYWCPCQFLRGDLYMCLYGKCIVGLWRIYDETMIDVIG